MSASNTDPTPEAMPSSVRWFAWMFFLANVGAVVWPGLEYFNRVEPMIFGLPFIMVWLAGWLVAALFMLAWIEHRLHGLGIGMTSELPGSPDSGVEN